MNRVLCIQNGIDIKKYKNSLKKELFRKSIHVSSAFVPLLLSYNRYLTELLLCVVLALYIICEALRTNGIEVPVVSIITSAAARKRDENHFVLGPVTLVLGIIFCALLWDEPYTAVGIYALAFGDGLASLVGKMFGQIKIPLTRGKTVAGSLACFAAIFCSAWLTTHNTKASLFVAVSGTCIEVLPLKDFDNVIIPVVLGGILKVLFPHI